MSNVDDCGRNQCNQLILMYVPQLSTIHFGFSLKPRKKRIPLFSFWIYVCFNYFHLDIDYFFVFIFFISFSSFSSFLSSFFSYSCCTRFEV